MFRLPFLSFFLLALLFGLGACKKTDTPKDTTDYAARDEALITDYIKTNNLTGFQSDTAGVYVAITEPGTGPLATKGKTLVVKYKGTLLDGTTFDQSDSRVVGFPFVLGAGVVIRGWDIAFKQLKKGSKAILLIPSNQAYGAEIRGVIPARSVLRFDVELVNIK